MGTFCVDLGGYTPYPLDINAETQMSHHHAIPDWIDTDGLTVVQTGSVAEVLAAARAYYGVRPAAPVVKRPHYATVSEALSALDAECLRIGMTGRRS